ncbi:MAG: F0F1 ATP synthase subunit A [bacterium]|nr:F0F1 ATP synthase subunit A [bacterium]
MNTRTRGFVTLGIILFVAVFFCAWVPFVFLPGLGIGYTLPVILLPSESIVYNFLPGWNLTNTFIATLITDALILIFVFLAWRASKGWTKLVPNRFQAYVEVFTEGIYNFLKNVGGERLRTAPLLWPLAATIFLFLLTANWMKLLPGVETVGGMLCAYEGIAGYARMDGATDGTYIWYNPYALRAGLEATYHDYEACKKYVKDGGEPYFDGAPASEHSAAGVVTVSVPAQEAEEEGEAEDVADAEDAEVLLARTREYFPDAAFPLNEEQLEQLARGEDPGVDPYIFEVRPFVRGAATDLNLTFMLAFLAIIAVQAYGVWAQGGAYFEKFVNVSALGNLGKRPLGAIDFVVGLIEIISEIGKIISLSFRLFGNLFAGGVALLAISFLVSVFIPGIILSLEIIIGAVQALVFAVLLVVFATQAMEGHHGGDDHDEHGAEHH